MAAMRSVAFWSAATRSSGMRMAPGVTTMPSGVTTMPSRIFDAARYAASRGPTNTLRNSAPATARTSSSSVSWSTRRVQPSGTGRSPRSFGTTTVMPVAVWRSARPFLSLGIAIASPSTARTASRSRGRGTGRADLELVGRASDGLAERGRLPAHEREIAIDALQIVPRGPGTLGDTLGPAAGLGGRVPGTLEVTADARALALALGALRGEGCGLLRELVVAREQRAILIGEPHLVTLAQDVRALGLDPRGLRLGQGDARA